MSDNVSHSVTVQFLVQGMGTDEDFDHRVELEKLLGDALHKARNGSCSGGDGGSGTMNVFLEINDPEKAQRTILKTLEAAGFLDDLIVAHTVHNEEAEDETETEVWWPERYPYQFTVFGPVWKGPLPEAELRSLDEDLRSLQGVWRLVRYDTPDGASLSEKDTGLQFLFVRDRLTVRRGMSVVSDARIQLDPSARPRHVDLHPTIGPNRSDVSQGIYQLDGDVLQFCAVPPGEERPSRFTPQSAHQVGRMILHREKG